MNLPICVKHTFRPLPNSIRRKSLNILELSFNVDFGTPNFHERNSINAFIDTKPFVACCRIRIWFLLKALRKIFLNSLISRLDNQIPFRIGLASPSHFYLVEKVFI